MGNWERKRRHDRSSHSLTCCTSPSFPSSGKSTRRGELSSSEILRPGKFLRGTVRGRRALAADWASFAAFGGIYFQNGCYEETAKGKFEVAVVISPAIVDGIDRGECHRAIGLFSRDRSVPAAGTDSRTSVPGPHLVTDVDWE